jgi:PQQ-dependent catabolism-associated CXXCW motif protein
MWYRTVFLSAFLALYALSFPIYPDDRPGDGTASPFGADGYRHSKYRAPTPATVPNGITVTTQRLQELIRRLEPILVDVQAVAVRPETEEFGFSWLPARQRFNLPGSVWLPNVGYGRLDKRMDDYFRSHLHRLTGGDPDHPIVIYCVIDCWMSWNAIRRAAAYGYRRLYWYREGTDGWAALGLPMQKAQPVPLNAASERE